MTTISALTLIDMKPNKLGALEEYALSISSALIREGHAAAVAFSELPPDWLMRRFADHGVEVLQIHPYNGASAFVRDLRQVVRRRSLNILHATFYPCYDLTLILATIGSRCNLIYSDQVSRTSHPSRGMTSLVSYCRNRLYQNAIAAIIADAEFIKLCQVQDHFTPPAMVPVIYNGVNLLRFNRIDPARKSQMLAELKIPARAPVIVTIAQCIPEKGLNYYIDAAQLVVRQHPNAVFFVLGDGPQRAALEQQATDRALRDRMIFTGVRVDTEAFLSIADVFVLLSVWEEAFAFSLLEAMASGCPVVATRVGAIPESVLDGVCGILVPPRSAAAAAAAICRLLADDAARSAMGLAARQRVEQYFSLDRWVADTIDLYKRVVEDSAHE